MKYGSLHELAPLFKEEKTKPLEKTLNKKLNMFSDIISYAEYIFSKFKKNMECFKSFVTPIRFNSAEGPQKLGSKALQKF